MSIQVRTASTDDYDGVTRLLRASYPILMHGAYEDSILAAALPAMTVTGMPKGSLG